MPIPIDWSKVFSHSSTQGQLTSYHKQLEAYFDADEEGSRKGLDDPGTLQPSSSLSPASPSSEGDEEVVP